MLNKDMGHSATCMKSDTIRTTKLCIINEMRMLFS